MAKSDSAGEIPPPRLGTSPYRRTTADLAADYIRQLIFSGYLTPGTRVPQEEIAQALNISRIPVREAIIALEGEGRIKVEKHRGAYVVAVNEESIRDGIQLTSMMMSFASRLAAERATPEEKAALDAVQKRMDASDDPVEVMLIQREHRALVVSAGIHPRFAQWIRGLDAIVADNFYEVIPSLLPIAKRESAKLTAAILAGDPDAATSVVWNMYSNSAEDVVRYHEDQGLFDAP
jgi:DNA-binding GntR family transcriptional regulator